eukprot:CAMPEP_0113712742 /NCGR_PEP_ID=MMETSP0038_2-20120614/31566_1 /TAXON_ID=2898 /ORGANISM="Cryptomonas paramecium" /LENGTH=244 /DNA_ID=CAMNT_0000639313 /DNA_START=48 /DNA_END=779 /DNA_ORIENTATION=+ /assembly_acc=CAM_ASM_000170
MASCFGLDSASVAHRYRLLRTIATSDPIALAFCSTSRVQRRPAAVVRRGRYPPACPTTSQPTSTSRSAAVVRRSAGSPPGNSTAPNELGCGNHFRLQAQQQGTVPRSVAPLAFACLADPFLTTFQRRQPDRQGILGRPALSRAIHQPVASPDLEPDLVQRALEPRRRPREPFAVFFLRWRGDCFRAVPCGLELAASAIFFAASSQLTHEEEAIFLTRPDALAALPQPFPLTPATATQRYGALFS